MTCRTIKSEGQFGSWLRAPQAKLHRKAYVTGKIKTTGVISVSIILVNGPPPNDFFWTIFLDPPLPTSLNSFVQISVENGVETKFFYKYSMIYWTNYQTYIQTKNKHLILFFVITSSYKKGTIEKILISGLETQQIRRSIRKIRPYHILK